MKFTPGQIKAINHRDGNLKIIACAGSGKTTVMAERIAKLISDGADRDKIVAFTYTEKAASSLKFKIRDCLNKRCPTDPHIGGMYIGTIHSYAFQVLRDIVPRYRNYDVLDEVKRIIWTSKNFGEIGIEQINPEDWHFDAIRKFLKSADIIRDKQIPYERLDQIPIFKSVYDEYLNQLDKDRYIDFSGIIHTLVETLQSNPELLASLKSKVNYLIVDEYQDVNHMQEKLISLISGGNGNLCVVGDDDQSIFEFQGAEVGNIIGFENRYDAVEKAPLPDNFRCPKQVIEAAQNFISRNRNRIHDKTMTPGIIKETVNGTEVQRINSAENGDLYKLEFDSIEDEVRFIMNKIEELKGYAFKEDGDVRGLDYGDMAIIVRNRASARRFIDPLRARGIKFTLKGEGGLFLKPEIHLVRAIFCFLADKQMRIIPEGEQKKVPELSDIRTLIEELNLRDLRWEDISSELTQMKARLTALDRPEAKRSGRIFLQEFFYELMELLKVDEEHYKEDVLYDFGRLSSLISEFEAIHGWINYYFFKKFVSFINGYAAYKTDQGGIDDPRNKNSVNIITVHAAKGLEFPVVFIPDLSTGRFPSRERYKIPENYLNDNLLDLSVYASGDEGERRLFYVACTRTKKFLFLTRAKVSETDHNVNRSCYMDQFNHEDIILENIPDPTQRSKVEPRCKLDLELMPTSFSDLKHYIDCPYRYLLQQMMGFSPKLELQYGYGLQVHNLLNYIHKNWETSPPTPEQIESLIESDFFLRYTRGEPLLNMKNKAKIILKNYSSEYGEEFKLKLETEKPFEYILGGALISGTIDLLQKIDPISSEVKEVCVLDYKTEEEKSETSKSNRLQVRLYALATQGSLGLTPKSAKIHHLTEGIRLDVPVTPEKLEETRNTITKVIDGIRKSDFKPCPAERCKKCDVRFVCHSRRV